MAEKKAQYTASISDVLKALRRKEQTLTAGSVLYFPTHQDNRSGVWSRYRRCTTQLINKTVLFAEDIGIMDPDLENSLNLLKDACPSGGGGGGAAKNEYNKGSKYDFSIQDKGHSLIQVGRYLEGASRAYCLYTEKGGVRQIIITAEKS